MGSLVYETNMPTRDSNGNIAYSINNSVSLATIDFNRVHYYM